MDSFLLENQYCNALKCIKKIWLYRSMPDKIKSNDHEGQLTSSVEEVKNLSKKLFKSNYQIELADGEAMCKETMYKISEYITLCKNDLKSGKTLPGRLVLSDAVIQYKDAVCHVDYLECDSNKNVFVYLVKSATHVKELYINEVAYCKGVLKYAGFNHIRCYIIHINSKYVRHGTIDIKELFAVREVTAKVNMSMESVMKLVDNINKVAEIDNEPVCEIGIHCMTPHKCTFWKHCTEILPEPSVFDIAGISLMKKFDMYNDGIVSYEDVEMSGCATERQLMQVKSELYDLKPFVNKNEIKKFIDRLSYPMYFLDFETYQNAVPEYDGVTPFYQIPFQYSLHIVGSDDAEPVHKEFLAEYGEDPRRKIAMQLVSDIPKDVCVIAYNMVFEKTVIKRLAELFPDIAENLMNIYSNIHDLMIPFQKYHYYNKNMHGSYSLKSVVPAMFPDDEQVNYDNLQQIHHGGEAMAAYCSMKNKSKQEQEIIKNNLLKYCNLDTLSLVRILEKLKQYCDYQYGQG